MTVYNFGAGPAQLPAAVMRQAQAEFLDWHDSGMSVIEMSHRSAAFAEIIEQAEQHLRRLLAIPADYAMLFLQGGATHLMSMLPLNFLSAGQRADYLHTGHWSGKAMKEAGRLAAVNIAATSAENDFTSLPPPSEWRLDPNAVYLYYCDNETISGVEFPAVPQAPGAAPLVSDMTSNFLSKPLDITQFACVFAGAQKNIGPAGLTVAIIRKDLIGKGERTLPLLYDFKTLAESNCLANTPATFSWYMAGLTFAWVAEQGGVAAMNARAVQRSALLYDCIDADDFYANPVDKACRSRMNVPFTLADAALDQAFLQEAAAQGLRELKGHRSVGGMRASIYNGMPLAGVQQLVEFMRDFSRRRG